MDDDAILAYWATYATASGYRPRSLKEHEICMRALLRRTGKSILNMTRHDLIADLGREGLRPATRQHYKSRYHWFPPPGRSGHVTPNNVTRVLSDAIRRAGIVGHTPHNLRAWYATELGEAGAPTDVIAGGLRHSDLQSVPRYRKVSERSIDHFQRRLPIVSIPDRTPRRRAA